MSCFLRMLFVTSILVLGMSCTHTRIADTPPTTSADRVQANKIPQASPTTSAYLPMVVSFTGFPLTRRVNAPYFGSNDVSENEAAIFWLGRVYQTENYADVRVGYNNTELFIKMLIFDRRLWYNPTPASGDLNAWDATTILVQLAGNTGDKPNSSSFRFDAQLNDWESSRSEWQAAYQGNGSGWTASPIPFTTQSGYRWESATVGGVNNNQNDRGWTMTFHIPFTSLGLIARPAPGTIWGLGLQVHDRDDAAGTPIADKIWPENLIRDQPSTWGQLHFGLPTYTPPSVTASETITIRNKLNGAVVPDIAAGGTISNQCPGDSTYIWNDWGNANFAGATDFILQNQGDVADWPCFSKAYITFPLAAIPPGKTIISASLVLNVWGGSESPNWPSLIQALTVKDDWNAATLTWNNAPLAVENVSQTWVQPVDIYTGRADHPYTWDVSYAVAQAYAANKPLRLALYEADTAQNSGKYFTGSNIEDYYAAGRPTLIVRYGAP